MKDAARAFGMEHGRQIAYETVLRACGFAWLGILCVMTVLSFDPKLAFQAGGFLTTLMAFFLILKSNETPTGDDSHTGIQLGVDRNFPAPDMDAQGASAAILRDTYLTFAMWTSLISIVMWLLALIVSFAGATSTLGRDDSGPVLAAPPQPVNVTMNAGELRRTVPAIRYQGFP